MASRKSRVVTQLGKILADFESKYPMLPWWNSHSADLLRFLLRRAAGPVAVKDVAREMNLTARNVQAAIRSLASYFRQPVEYNRETGTVQWMDDPATMAATLADMEDQWAKGRLKSMSDSVG